MYAVINNPRSLSGQIGPLYEDIKNKMEYQEIRNTVLKIADNPNSVASKTARYKLRNLVYGAKCKEDLVNSITYYIVAADDLKAPPKKVKK